jgi:ElaA protein
MSLPQVIWALKPFAELTPLELHDMLKLRVDVFVIEQRCVYPELDGLDPSAWHLWATTARGKVAAYARILPPHGDEPPHIGRVIVHPDQRGLHLGRHLMHRALEAVRRIHGTERSALAAQAYLQTFYGSFGYVPVSKEYLWDGIPHVDMVRNG